MNLFDVIIILIILMFGVAGFKNGIIKELTSLIGIIVVFIISYSLKGFIGNILCSIFPFFNFSGSMSGLISLNVIIYQMIGFFVIFSILMTIFHIVFFVSKVLQKIIDFTLILLLPSKLLGAVVGLIKGVVIVFILLVVLQLPLKNIEIFESSELKTKIINTPPLSMFTKDIKEPLENTSLLIKKIDEKKISVNDANLQIVDDMLKYKIVNADTIDGLVKSGKLSDIHGISKIINNYK